jgi:hypothetical protein
VRSRVHLGRYLDDAKAPPGGTDTVNGACRTRTASVTHSRTASAIWEDPAQRCSRRSARTRALSVNNIGAFDGAGDSLAGGLAGHRVNTSDTSIYYGLNARGAVQQPRRRTGRPYGIGEGRAVHA